MPGSKGLNPHELAHRWIKDLGTRPDMEQNIQWMFVLLRSKRSVDIKVERKLHDMRMSERIVEYEVRNNSYGINQVQNAGTKNVPWHILAPAALLSANGTRLATTVMKRRRLRHLPYTPQCASPRSVFLLYRKAISCKVRKQGNSSERLPCLFFYSTVTLTLFAYPFLAYT